MKKLLEYILENILEDKNDLAIIEEEGESFKRLTVNLPADKVGLVIGKRGKIIQAIRTLLKISSIQKGQKFLLEVESL